ncbi:hypothetical protein [uncultured Prevotella sp.]|uniref:hypothetical protein n=2 Tax=uncultured Prevotella sp. TaxID=159272 RepID=UPI00260E3C9C|nr:hypothetical protein [uncultured Prevotella sp.]
MIIPNYFILIVLYNKTPKNSSTIVSLSNIDKKFKPYIKCLICDNSKKQLDNKDMSELHYMLKNINHRYKHNNGQNKPLSKIYNDTINKLAENEYLIIFDDDSSFDSDFFEKSSQAIIHNKEINLFLPIVYDRGKIISPAKMIWFKGHYLKSITPGMINSKNITAINSGMIINAQYLKHKFIGYDERIKFYFTDNDFMDKFTSTNKKLFILDYKMNHTLNFYLRGENFEIKKKRFKDLRRSYLILMRRKGNFMYYVTHIYLFIYSIKFSIQQRDIRFIFVF